MGLVKIYDRRDTKNIPHGSDRYIIDDYFNSLYHVRSNIYGVSFEESFKTKGQALEYYHKLGEKGYK